VVYPEIPALPFETLVEASSNVLYAHVVSVTPVVPAQGAARTDYGLEVHFPFKSPVAEQVTVSVGGAMIDGKGTVVMGAPAFEVGDEVVLLACDTGSTDELGILALEQGVYRVRTDVDGTPLAFGASAPSGIPLDMLFQRIDAVLAATSEKEGR